MPAAFGKDVNKIYRYFPEKKIHKNQNNAPLQTLPLPIPVARVSERMGVMISD